MTDSEIRQKVWEIFDRYKGIDSLVISHLFSLRGAMAGEQIPTSTVFREFVAIDNLLDDVRELVKPDRLKRVDTVFFQS